MLELTVKTFLISRGTQTSYSEMSLVIQ